MADCFVCFTCPIVEAMPHVLDSFPLFSHLERGRLCPSQGCMPLYPLTFLLTLDYDILGLRIEEESPDGAPHDFSKWV
jgi:hypothetical protein